ncbi:MAG TPA: DUF362 domain-containing protein [Candidatus Sumerlaeota bacterium]|nr:DUF362 domain-containing protein [Candidatus Sumerlaeota bacterium]
MALQDNRTSVTFTQDADYPRKIPFHPAKPFPEYRGKVLDPTNPVYGAVRDLLRQLELDRENYGTPAWNPLGSIIQPGMTVFIKPNTVLHTNLSGDSPLAVVVHASVLRPLLDYTCLALRGEGRIIIGDSQLIESHFDEALDVSQVGPLVQWYRQKTAIPLECLDLRSCRSVRTWLYGKWGRVPVQQDPRGYTFVNLGENSYFRDIDPKKLRIAIASHKVMFDHHSGGRHEYLFPNSFLESDVILNVAKLKTHRRTAITLALKNFMGLPALKDTLPHFMVGSPEEGGDQYIHPSRRKRIGTWMHDLIQTTPNIPLKFVTAIAKRLLWNSHYIWPFQDDVYEAMWPGNDTLWRTLLDLNRIALYADKKGVLQDRPQRGYLSLIDGIIGGEGDGPLSPGAVQSRTLLAGFNPVALDYVAATLMGFDPDKIPLIRKGVEDTPHTSPLFWGSPSDIQVVDPTGNASLADYATRVNLHYKAHPSWAGHAERP